MTIMSVMSLQYCNGGDLADYLQGIYECITALCLSFYLDRFVRLKVTYLLTASKHINT